MSDDATKEQERKIMAEGVTPGLATCLYIVGGIFVAIGAVGTIANMGENNYAGVALCIGSVLSGLLFCAIAAVLTRLHRAVYHLGRCAIWLERNDEWLKRINERAARQPDKGENQKEGPGQPQRAAYKSVSQDELDRCFKEWQQKGR
jgi:hypothetical protein